MITCIFWNLLLKNKDLNGCVWTARFSWWSAHFLHRDKGGGTRWATERRFHLLISFTDMSFTRSLSPWWCSLMTNEKIRSEAPQNANGHFDVEKSHKVPRDWSDTTLWNPNFIFFPLCLLWTNQNREKRICTCLFFDGRMLQISLA